MDDPISDMIRQRREALSGADDGRRPWGLALSGGGIRSATFCLGLLKALAQGRQLLRFDLVSTVSGGGYIGSTLGRLCTRAGGPDDVRAVEGAFGEVDKMRFGWWLRSNGRYLIPGGLRDTLFAVSLYLRNLLGTHIEIAIAATLIGLGLAMLNLLAWEGVAATVDLDNGQVASLPLRLATQVPTLWLAGVVPWGLSIVLACAYWSVRDRPSARSTLGQIAMWCALGGGAWWLRDSLETRYDGPAWLAPAFIAFSIAWVVALGWVLLRGRHQRSPALLRNELTEMLTHMVYLMLVVVLLGLLDWSAWWLATNTSRARVSYGGVLLVAAAAMRGVLPLLASGQRDIPGPGKRVLFALGSVAGLAAAFCLAAWWIGVLYAAVLLPVFTSTGLDFSRGWVWLGVIGAAVASYAVCTGHNFSFLNLSSLHMFYKARIVRGYLGAANGVRLGGDPVTSVTGLAPPQVPVGQVHAGDDIAQRDYAPHRHGGPVHLINVCINQTHDPKQKLFNRDRRSLPLTIGPQGWMQAVGAPWTQARGDGALSLGAWTAISGAAFAPGLGRMTRRGIAALSVFAGLRLGFWWDSKQAGIAQPGAGRRVGTWLMKTRYLLLECFAAFPGSGSANWYLSDGGHFENTGAYALLRREAELIVLADCGADPTYGFGDLENLIRRARIDLNAEIVFLKPGCDAEGSWRCDFGSLSDLASSSSQACLALARIDYASGLHGHMVLVKPNVSADLPVDLVNFKAANPLFPQQPTTDQFFDEAQWESYFQLGSEIGQRLGGEMLTRVAGGADSLQGLFEPDDGQPTPAAGHAARTPADVTKSANGKENGNGNGNGNGTTTAASRLQARVLQAGAVTASIGLGTAATLGVAAWQGIDSWRTERGEQDRAESLAFKELTERWSRLGTTVPPGGAPAALAAELLRTGDLLCRSGRENFLARFQLPVRIVDDAKGACRAELKAAAPSGVAAVREAGDPPVPPASPACIRLLDRDNGIACLQAPVAPACAPRYWARDYSGRTIPLENCGGFGTGASSLLAAVATRLGSPFEARSGPTQAPANAMPPPPAAAGEDSRASVSAIKAGRARAGACAGAMVYVRIFGPEQRSVARALRRPWQALGASVPQIDDVLASSRAAGHAPPPGHAEPTIVYQDPKMRDCADLLSRTQAPPSGDWSIQPMEASLQPRPGTLVVWLPRPGPYAQTSQTSQGAPAAPPGAR